MYCQHHRRDASRPWDTSTGFVLNSRSLDVWLLGPFKPLTPVFNTAAQIWPNWGVRRCGAGELTARYEVVGE
jgi:hypothetical protein